MFIITGANGFIGHNLYKKIKKKYNEKILVIDDLDKIQKSKKIQEETIDFRDFDKYNLHQKDIKAIFHLGAITDTTFNNFDIIEYQNTQFSKKLYDFISNNNNCYFIYASSASVYGKQTNSNEIARNEIPINLYSKSKLNFDNYVRNKTNNFLNKKNKIFGLRYFNVYGPGEYNKGKMASVVFHFYNQLIKEKKVKLFKGSDGYGNGEQQRDFIYVDDVTNITMDIFEGKYNPGIYNLGTGIPTSFNKIANIIIKELNMENKALIEYIEFPSKLLEGYQSYTCANLNAFKKNGLNYNFQNIEEGISKYINELKKK